jgi:hypothetical protein
MVCYKEEEGKKTLKVIETGNFVSGHKIFRLANWARRNKERAFFIMFDQKFCQINFL